MSNNWDYKRFERNYRPIADAISRADISQIEREALAEAMADALDGIANDKSHGRAAAARIETGWNRATFASIARDPMVDCAGYTLRATGEHVPCPEGRSMRLGWHDSSQPNGRNIMWQDRLPTGHRCISCGAREFIPGHQQEAITA